MSFTVEAQAPIRNQQLIPLDVLPSEVQCHASKSCVFSQGDKPAGVFILRRGSVKLSVAASKAKAVILWVAQAGDMLALSEFLSGGVALATAETLEETEVCFVESQRLRQYLAKNPELLFKLAGHVSSSYQSACRRVALLGFCYSVSERVAQFLLGWLGSKPADKNQTSEFRLTPEDIAQIIGASRETVARTLADFRENGWAFVEDLRLVIKDREALQRVAAAQGNY